MKPIAEQISSRLLPRVRQPSQYIGREFHARHKDLTTARVRFALAFPDLYTIGISHLGHQVLYHRLNDLPKVACDRAYCPAPDAEAVMREQDVPMFAWESRCRLAEFDVIGFSLGYELCITSVLTMLDLAGIPLLAADRDDSHPLILGGDALADSPEPIAEFFDVFLPGDGEEPIVALAQLLQEIKPLGLSRDETLLRIAQEVPSAYVPQFYEPADPAPDGRPVGVRPVRDDVPAEIPRACLRDLSPPDAHPPLVPLAEAVHDRVVVEVMRGCPNLCRFCQAGHARSPVRHRPMQEILDEARRGVEASGSLEVSLLSLSTSDYPNLEDLLRALHEQFQGCRVNISLPSLRVDKQLTILPTLTSEVRKSGLTIAAEAGSERLRRAIRKTITEEDMCNGVRAAWKAGWRSVKVYFMAGLPGETMDDIDAIFALCKKLSETRRDHDGHPGAISGSVSWFVPKPHTPMQWEPMQTADYFFAVRRRLIDLAQRSTVNFKFHRIERSLLEGLLCRGSRGVARAVLAAWRRGARLDAWNEHWNWELWQEAIRESGVVLDDVIHTALCPRRPTPWSHIRCHLGEEYFRRQRDQMLAELARPS
jgi:radical SAM family uncharacterized protein